MYKSVVVVFLLVSVMAAAQQLPQDTGLGAQHMGCVAIGNGKTIPEDCFKPVIGISGNGSVGDASGTIKLSKIEPKKPKTWLDTQTKIELGLAFASIAADGYTTVWNGGRGTSDINPLIGKRNGSPTFDGFFFAGSAGALFGSNYMLRKHPRLKHVLNWTVIGLEAEWVHLNTSWHRR